MIRILLIIITNLLFFVISAMPVSAQTDCANGVSASAGEFGPTCAATIPPATNTPAPQATLPPVNTPIPELPRSGNGATAASIIFGGGIIFLLGVGTLSLNKNKK